MSEVPVVIEVDVRPFLAAVESAMNQLRRAFGIPGALLGRPARRRVELRRMHTAYRQRTRARRRS